MLGSEGMMVEENTDKQYGWHRKLEREKNCSVTLTM
jgi:hypothetical protein